MRNYCLAPLAYEGLAGGAKAAAAHAAGTHVVHARLRDPAAAIGAIAQINTVAAIIMRVEMALGTGRFAKTIVDDNVIVVDAALGFNPVATVIFVATIHDRRGKGRQEHQGDFGRSSHRALSMDVGQGYRQKNDRLEKRRADIALLDNFSAEPGGAKRQQLRDEMDQNH